MNEAIDLWTLRYGSFGYRRVLVGAESLKHLWGSNKVELLEY